MRELLVGTRRCSECLVCLFGWLVGWLVGWLLWLVWFGLVWIQFVLIWLAGCLANSTSPCRQVCIPRCANLHPQLSRPWQGCPRPKAQGATRQSSIPSPLKSNIRIPAMGKWTSKVTKWHLAPFAIFWGLGATLSEGGTSPRPLSHVLLEVSAWQL